MSTGMFNYTKIVTYLLSSMRYIIARGAIFTLQYPCRFGPGKFSGLAAPFLKSFVSTLTPADKKFWFYTGDVYLMSAYMALSLRFLTGGIFYYLGPAR